MTHTFVVYIDESGDEGFTFRDPPDKGSSDWFVLSAVVVRLQNDHRLVSQGRILRAELGFQPNHTLHFIDISHDRRVRAFNEMVKMPIKIVNVFINKRELRKPQIFTEAPFRLYKYASRLLLERVSWLCRDAAREHMLIKPEARIIFEHRRRMSYDDMRAYVESLKAAAEFDDFFAMLVNDIRIHWPVVNTKKIESAQKHDYFGLQLADFAASGFKHALENSKYGTTEHRYAKILKPIVYGNKDNFTSYGLKFFPCEPSDCHWIRKYYK